MRAKTTVKAINTFSFSSYSFISFSSSSWLTSSSLFYVRIWKPNAKFPVNNCIERNEKKKEKKIVETKKWKMRKWLRINHSEYKKFLHLFMYIFCRTIFSFFFRSSFTFDKCNFFFVLYSHLHFISVLLSSTIHFFFVHPLISNDRFVCFQSFYFIFASSESFKVGKEFNSNGWMKLNETFFYNSYYIFTFFKLFLRYNCI